MASNGQNAGPEVRTLISNEVIRKHQSTPMTLYRIRDAYDTVVSNDNFTDAMLATIGFVALSAALPFYPLLLTLLLAIVVFYAGLRHGFLGLILMFVLAFPMFAFQVPAIALLFVIVMAFSLIYGYMHYRTIAFLYILIALPFSPIGYILEIPMFMFAVITIGHKRSLVLAVLVVLGVVALSGMTGVHNMGYIPYDQVAAHTAVASLPLANYSVPVHPRPNLITFANATGTAESNIDNGYIFGYSSYSFVGLAEPLGSDVLSYLGFIAVLVVAIFGIDMFAVASRSRYKGTESTMVAVLYPISYAVLSGSGAASDVLAFSSFILGVAAIFVLEFYGADVVKSLEVRKNDTRMKFGDAFESLSDQNSGDRFSGIGNYEATKKELFDAIISPIEQRGVSNAYNVRPVRGVLLFGPPGTGKTKLMRAMANEIHANFYVVKAANIVSAVPGESERKIANVFSIARKNAPCVLFIDEIDAIARSRKNDYVDETHRQILSQLLVEMDGIEKAKRVIVVGATNVPQTIDAAILRPGRFDRIIYVPVPDLNGRKAIFDIYLRRLPVSRRLSTLNLAKATERYSGADIKSICESVAQEVAGEAAEQHTVLEITEEDLLAAIKKMKPSSNIAMVEEYNRFRIDFERRVLGQTAVEAKEKTAISDIVGLDDAKTAVRDAIEIPLLHPDLMNEYGVRNIKGLLMFGPPGNGKTMLMKAISSEMQNVTVLQISGSDLLNQNIEGAVAAVKETFNRATENAPAIVLIDEIDGLVPVRKASDRFGIQLTNEILQQLDGVNERSGVVLVGATNRPYALDPAILRPGRLDKIVFVRPPNQKERSALFRHYLTGAPLGTIDFDRLGSESGGYTGADISNICRESKNSAMHAAISMGARVSIGMPLVEKIMKSVKPSAPPSVVKEYEQFMQRYGER